MKERPILFTGEMVRAILDGRKTQTRRVVKPQPVLNVQQGREQWTFKRKGVSTWLYDHKGPWTLLSEECPYGQPGDRLWVRETFAWHPEFPGSSEFIFRADRGGDYQGAAQGDFKWSPSIHMPRAASRIDLEIESVRVERVQEITAEDAVAEGLRVERGAGMIEGEPIYMFTTNSGYMRGKAGAIAAFRDLWDSINAKRGFGWEANPWVWVITFRRAK